MRTGGAHHLDRKRGPLARFPAAGPGRRRRRGVGACHRRGRQSPRPDLARAGTSSRPRTSRRPAKTQSRDPAARLTTLRGNRSNVWRSARRAFDSAPFKGIGPGTFEYWWNRDDGEEYVRDGHSLYLESLAEQGVPGLVLVLVFLLGLLGLGLRARFTLREARSPGALAAPLGALVVFFLHAGVDWMWETTAVAALAILGGGIAAAAPARRRPTPLFALRIAIPAVAVLAILVQIPGLVSTSQVRDSQASVKQGRLQEALVRANDAVEAQPWAASPYVQRALVEQSTGRLEAAAVDLRRAVRREPTNWRLPLQLAVVQAERGRTVRPCGRTAGPGGCGPCHRLSRPASEP